MGVGVCVCMYPSASPLVLAVEARDEQRHRLVGGAGLQLVNRRLPLTALATPVHRDELGGHVVGLVVLQVLLDGRPPLGTQLGG